MPVDAPFLRTAFSLRRRSSSDFKSSSDMALPGLIIDKAQVYRYWSSIQVDRDAAATMPRVTERLGAVKIFIWKTSVRRHSRFSEHYVPVLVGTSRTNA